MILWASGLGLRVDRFSRQLRGVGVIAKPDAQHGTMELVEVPLGAAVLRVHVPAMVVRVLIDRLCIADGVEFKHCVITKT
jgi:hypothetical protein